MAHKYVYHAAAGSGTGADWTNAYTTLEAAVEAAGTAAGDNIWVAHDHAETAAAAKNILSKNTAAAPGTVICVNRAGTVPPVEADLRTTATVTTTGAFAMSFGGAGGTYIYGIIFQSGSGAVNVTLTFTGVIFLDNCACANSAPPATPAPSSSPERERRHSRQYQRRLRRGRRQYRSLLQSDPLEGNRDTDQRRDHPQRASVARRDGSSEMVCHGVDFSQIAAATPLYSFAAGFGDQITLLNCKLKAAQVICTTPTTDGGGTLNLLNCDSGAINYRNERYRYQGTQTTETTIVRTGGATDGATPVSWKFVTNANSKWLYPFDSLPITIWNDTVGSSKTLTVYGIWGGGAVPNNDDLWFEVGYLGSSATPIGSAATSGKASYLAANAAYASDSSTWGGSTTKFKMTATFTPQMKGPIFVLIRVAKLSTTVYIDPEIEVT